MLRLISFRNSQLVRRINFDTRPAPEFYAVYGHYGDGNGRLFIACGSKIFRVDYTTGAVTHFEVRSFFVHLEHSEVVILALLMCSCASLFQTGNQLYHFSANPLTQFAYIPRPYIDYLTFDLTNMNAVRSAPQEDFGPGDVSSTIHCDFT